MCTDEWKGDGSARCTCVPSHMYVCTIISFDQTSGSIPYQTRLQAADRISRRKMQMPPKIGRRLRLALRLIDSQGKCLSCNRYLPSGLVQRTRVHSVAYAVCESHGKTLGASLPATCEHERESADKPRPRVITVHMCAAHFLVPLSLLSWTGSVGQSVSQPASPVSLALGPDSWVGPETLSTIINCGLLRLVANELKIKGNDR